jgi:translation initiation factor IF-2
MANSTKKTTEKMQQRPPVIAVMGHVDHGKSALLDYIRNTKVVESEAGGITQKVSAYEVLREYEGKKKLITFLDTPGHEAFSKIRERGATVADIAILVVSAEEGVKPQTLDALRAIKEAGVPYVVAINKIDKPGADITRTQSSLVEHEVYIEGMGGSIPWNAISAKTGEGVNELLDTLLLVAEMEELSADPTPPADGVVIEAQRDSKKGVAATLVIKNGTLKSGEYIVAGNAMAPVRIFENFMGTPIRKATFSSPVRIIGFDTLPDVGAKFHTYSSKKEAELARQPQGTKAKKVTELNEDDTRHLVPLIVKADASGTIEAIEHEIDKLQSDRVLVTIIQKGIGNISEADIKAAVASTHDALVIGFNVGTDAAARDVALQYDVSVNTFNIIYKLAEWLEQTIRERTPKMEVENELGEAKIMKYYSSMKNKHVIGGKVKRGVIKKGARVHIQRDGKNVGSGVVRNLQTMKQSVTHIDESGEFGAQIESDITPRQNDRLLCYEVVEK